MVKIKGWKKEANGQETTQVIKKIGNWDIGFIKYGNSPKTFLMIRGLSYGENPIIYSHYKPMKLGYDRPEQIPDSVKNWLYKNANKIFITQKRLNREGGSTYLQ